MPVYGSAQTFIYSGSSSTATQTIAGQVVPAGAHYAVCVALAWNQRTITGFNIGAVAAEFLGGNTVHSNSSDQGLISVWGGAVTPGATINVVMTSSIISNGVGGFHVIYVDERPGAIDPARTGVVGSSVTLVRASGEVGEALALWAGRGNPNLPVASCADGVTALQYSRNTSYGVIGGSALIASGLADVTVTPFTDATYSKAMLLYLEKKAFQTFPRGGNVYDTTILPPV